MSSDSKKPPDIPKLSWDKNKSISYTSSDPVYLLMSRINSDANATLSNVSPFLVKKAIDCTCGQQVEECKVTRSGDILIKTKNSVQANKLIKLTALSNNIFVNITLHKSLNFVKGVIYCNSLRGIPEEEIHAELKEQNVHEVKKILKKNQDNELIETGLIIITFASTNLPHKINIGYEKVPIRPYIPPPMRCKNCYGYNHTAKYCKNPKVCPCCAREYHIKDETTEICVFIRKCINCSALNISPDNHPAYDKKCPVFIKETELQYIKTTYKVDNKTAKQIYSERHQHDTSLYSEVTKTNNNNPTQPQNSIATTNTTNPTITPPITSTEPSSSSSCKILSNTRKITDYSDLTAVPSRITQQKVKILPRNTPRRLLNKIKKVNSNNLDSLRNKSDKGELSISEEDMDTLTDF